MHIVKIGLAFARRYAHHRRVSAAELRAGRRAQN
jgi:hypothetical protein